MNEPAIAFQETDDLSDQALIAQYFRLQKAAEKIEAEYKAKMAPYTKGMNDIKGYIHLLLNERGAKHTTTIDGTAFKVRSMSVKCTDKAAYLRFCFGDPDWGANLLTAQVSKDTLSEFMDKHDNQTPPGINVSWTDTVQIRRT